MRNGSQGTKAWNDRFLLYPLVERGSARWKGFLLNAATIIRSMFHIVPDLYNGTIFFLSPPPLSLYSFHRCNFLRNIFFRIPHIPNIYLLRTLTKLRREFLLKCELIKSSALICTFLAYIPLVIFRTCRVFFLLFARLEDLLYHRYKKRIRSDCLVDMWPTFDRYAQLWARTSSLSYYLVNPLIVHDVVVRRVRYKYREEILNSTMKNSNNSSRKKEFVLW